MIYDIKTRKVYVKDSSGELKELGNLDCYEVEPCAYDEVPTVTVTMKLEPGNFRICEDVFKDLYRTEYCIVTDSGLCYATYDDWIRKNFGWYITYFEYNHSLADIKSDRLYKIIGHAPHSDNLRTELYLIQDTDTEQVFIVEEEGIKRTTIATIKNHTTTLRCDKLDTTISCDIKGGERNMNNKVVDLYYNRKKEEIRDKYAELSKKEYEELDVVKEYNELVETFKTSLAEMADRYNTEETKVLVRTGYTNTYMYELNDNLRDEIKEIHRKEYDIEIKALELLVEEVRAQLSLSDDKDYQIDILTKYDIINKKGKLNV